MIDNQTFNAIRSLVIPLTLGWVIPIILGLATGLVAIYFLGPPTKSAAVDNSRWSKACDIVIREFVRTGNPVELQRAEYLLNHLHCDVTSRATSVLVPGQDQ